MKKSISFLMICFVAAACNPKAIPKSDKNLSDKKTPVSVSPERQATLAQGQALYESSCGRCHDLKDPSKYTVAEWRPIMERMAPKAKLNMEQKTDVLTYVLSKAKSIKN
jgi:cytochrome c5